MSKMAAAPGTQGHDRLVSWLPVRRWVRGHLSVLLVAALSLAATAGAWQAARREARQELQVYFDYRVRDVVDRIEQRMAAYRQVLLGAHGFITSAPGTRRTFSRYVAELRLDRSFPGIQGVGYAVVVPPADMDRHVAHVRAEGFPAYQVWPGGTRPRYTSIVYLEPFSKRNLRAFGYDMYSEPVRREAMDRACDLGEVTISATVRLVQETDEQPQAGFLVYLPVYRDGGGDANVSAREPARRRADLVGWVYAPFRMNDLMAGILGERGADLDVEVHDGRDPSSASLMFDSAPAHDRAERDAGLRAVEPLDIVGHRWTLSVRARPGLGARLGGGHAGATLGGGLVASALLVILTWTLVTRNQALEARVADRTEALSASEGERARVMLEQRVILDNANVGIIFARDRTQIWGNRRMAELLGYSPDDVSPRPARHAFPSDDAYEQLGRDAYPVLAEGRVYQAEIEMVRHDGTRFWASIHGKAIDPDNPAAGSIWTFDDVSARKAMELKLRASEEKYAALFWLLPIGAAITDAHGKLVEVNHASESLLGLTRSQHLDRTFDAPVWDIVRPDGSAMPIGEFASVRAMRENQTVEDVEMGVRRADGSLVWLLASSMPVHVEGYGVAIVYKDITERRLAEEATRRSLREKETLLREIHHRVKNNMQVVSSILELQAQQVAGPEFKAVLLVAQRRVKAMALLHEKLYQTKDLATIDIADYLATLANETMAAHGLGPPRLTVRVCAPGIQLGLDSAMPCALVVSELLSNCFKYAFPPPRVGEVEIGLVEWQGSYLLTVRDNGIGLPEGFDLAASPSLGLKLVSVLARQLRGTFRLTSANGVAAEVVFPGNEVSS